MPRRRDAPPAVHFKPTLSSLSLQRCLFFNALFSLFFAVIIGSCSVQKLLYYNKRVSISTLCIWAAIEPARLYYGFSGNLRERVPELSTYLLISLFPQLPFILYLAYVQPVQFPSDPILGSFMLVFLLLELAIGVHAVFVQIKSQTAQFMRLCEDEGVDDDANGDGLALGVNGGGGVEMPYSAADAAAHHRRT